MSDDLSPLELRQIMKELSEGIHASLGNRVTEIQAIKTEGEQNAEKIGRVLKLLEGNARPPITERVATIEILQAQLTGRSEKHDQKFDRLNWWIIGLLVGLVGSLAATVVGLLKA